MSDRLFGPPRSAACSRMVKRGPMLNPIQSPPVDHNAGAGSTRNAAENHEHDRERAGRRPMPRGMRVLVATDLSDAADVALREGAALASAPGAALAVIHVVPELPFLQSWPSRPGDEEAKIAARAIETTRARTHKVVGERAEVFVELGVDYAAIIKRAEAWDADLIVVGSHGRSGVARAFGGVAERVLRHAPCSVLVARPAGARGWVLAATDLSPPSFAAITSGGRRGAATRGAARSRSGRRFF